MDTTVTDARRVKDDSLGPAATVSTSTLKPKEAKAPKPKAKKKKKTAVEKVAQAEREQAALDVVLGAPEGAAEGALRSAEVEQATEKPKPRRARPPAPAPAPTEEHDAFAGLSPVDYADAWCGLCGRICYATPNGPACRGGHSAPPRLNWEEVALWHYERGTAAGETAALMAAEETDIAEYFGELDARPPVAEEKSDAVAEDAERDRALEAPSAEAAGGAAVESPAPVVEPSEPAPVTAPAPAPVAEEVVGAIRIEVSGISELAAEIAAEEARDAEQLQPVFAVGDFVTPVNEFTMYGVQGSGSQWRVVAGAELRVAGHRGSTVHVVDALGTAACWCMPEEIRHLTEAIEEPAQSPPSHSATAAPRGPRGYHQGESAGPPPAVEGAHYPGNVGIPLNQGPSWTDLQLGSQPFTAAEYERIGRLWVAALTAGVSIQTQARREREVGGSVRDDILGRHG